MTGTRRAAAIVSALTALALAAPAAAQNISGAIFTTTSGGTTVNGNIFQSKSDVYLDGGPQNTNANGLTDGTYYFQVTDPSGSTLLSTDDISCRQVVVVNGAFAGNPGGALPAACTTGYHPNGTPNQANGSIPVQLMPYGDTSNPGGEYKVWVTPVGAYDVVKCASNFGFCDATSKTDNFKVRQPGAAYVTVCKFNDANDSGVQDTGEPLLPHWPITATGVDTGGGTSQTDATQTDDSGCVSFAVSVFPNNGTQTVTLSEGIFGKDWTQTAPVSGTYDANGNLTGTGPTSVTGGVITVIVSPGDDITAPYFGNHNPDCGVSCFGNSLIVTKTANPSQKFTWQISKAVDNVRVNDSTGTATFNYTVSVTHDSGTGWVVNGTIRVSNPTPDAITGVNVTDVIDNGGTCTITDSNGGVNESIPAGTHADIPYTCTFASNPVSGINTATATWSDGNPSGTAAYSFAAAISDGSVTVTDTLGGALGTVSYTDSSPKTFTYAHTFTGDPAGTCTMHDNTATFTTDTTGTTGTASQTVTQCVGADLTVTKTAAASFNSAVAKSVNQTKVEQAGDSATFNYTVTVTESGWTVSGAITVSNPNDWEDITATVTDAINNGGTCSVTGGAGVLVTRGGTVNLPYTCSYASRPSAAAFTNTATAVWNPTASATPDGSASGMAGGMFAALTITDNVQSSAYPSGCTATLGTVGIATTTPNGSAGCGLSSLTSPSWGVFKYSITDQNAAPGTCQSYNNTAQIVGGASSSQVTVTVCNTTTGALTMGFWKNTNGQGIIKAYCGGGAGLTAYLAGFNPFKDDTATTCAGEAAYVANIINAATCSSSSNTCNAMLRAQMLATALDVYFSTASLGGNRIGAYNGLGASTPQLGAVNVDLSSVCSASDGGVGTACGSGSEDARPEFGIVNSCLGTTVAQMLAYANYPSTVNGSPVATPSIGAIWYQQSKSKQVFAKDGFDDVNNQLAKIAPSSCSPTF